MKERLQKYIKNLEKDIYRLRNENGRLIYKSEEELNQIASDIRLINDIKEDLEKILEGN